MPPINPPTDRDVLIAILATLRAIAKMLQQEFQPKNDDLLQLITDAEQALGYSSPSLVNKDT